MKHIPKSRPAGPHVPLSVLRRLAQASLAFCATATLMKSSQRAGVYPKGHQPAPSSKRG